MWGSTRIPTKIYQVLYPLKRHFRCAQGQHFLVFCWWLVALIRDPGKGTLKGLMSYLPPTLKYWTTMRMIRSGQWDAAAVIKAMATTTLQTLPPPADGVLYLIGDSTLKDKRGRKHPLGHITRHREHEPYTFGFEMVLLIASWDWFRIPVALAPIDPQCRGHQNILFRQMLQAFVPPTWARQIVVVADAGFAANATMCVIAEQHYMYVFAMPRTRKFTIQPIHVKPRGGMLPPVGTALLFAGGTLRWAGFCPSATQRYGCGMRGSAGTRQRRACVG